MDQKPQKPRVTPFELSITVLEVGGLYGSLNGVVKVEVAVEDDIIGLTSGRSTHPSIPGTLSGSLTMIQSSDVTKSTRLFWTNHNLFSIPLTSLENHNISFTLFFETDRAVPVVIGRAKTDSNLGSLLWSQVNRKFDMGLPVTLETQNVSSPSQFSTPYVVVQLQLLERALFHLSINPDIPSSSLLTSPRLSIFSPPISYPINQERLDPLEYLIDEFTSALQESALFSADARDLATYSISKVNIFLEDRDHRAPLLLLSPSHRQDICADYQTLTDLRSLREIDHRIYPIPLIPNEPREVFVTGDRSLHSSLPLPRQILHLHSLQSSVPYLSLGRKGTHDLHQFSFSQPSNLMKFLKAVSKAQSSDLHSSDEFPVQYHGHGFGQAAVPCLLRFEMVDGQESICCTGTQDPSVSVSISIFEIDHLASSLCPPLSFPVVLDLEISNFLNDDIRSGGMALFTILTASGQYETAHFSCDSNLRRSERLRIFCGFEDLANGSAMIGIHLQESPTKDIQTLGEAIVHLSTMVQLRRDSDPPSFLSHTPNPLRIQLQPPRYALMSFFFTDLPHFQ